MKKIIIASQNPVKIKATLQGFKSMFSDEKFQVKGVEVDSGVKDQPMTDEETLKGAINRCNQAFQLFPGADFYVGVEGGVDYLQKEMICFAWVVIKSSTKIGKGKSATFFLPQKAKIHIEQGAELGHAMDRIFNQKNIKQKNGAIGLLTDNSITRTELYISAIITALIPFKQKNLYD